MVPMEVSLNNFGTLKVKYANHEHEQSNSILKNPLDFVVVGFFPFS
jgi:hypothetical protein